MRSLSLTLLLVGMSTLCTLSRAQGISISPAHAQADYKISDKLDTQLKNKMVQALNAGGMVSNDPMARFALLPTIGIISESTKATIPAKTEMELDFTFSIVDWMTGNVYDTYSIPVQTKGTNKQNALAKGASSLTLNTPDFQSFLDRGRHRIISYYESNLNNILSQAMGLSKQGEYEHALYLLSEVPSCIGSYRKVVDTMSQCYIAYNNKIAADICQRAESAWIAEPNATGAREALAILSDLPANTTSAGRAKALMRKIEKKLSVDERRQWALLEKELNRKHKEEMATINAVKAIGVAYAKSQPKQVTNTVLW